MVVDPQCQHNDPERRVEILVETKAKQKQCSRNFNVSVSHLHFSQHPQHAASPRYSEGHELAQDTVERV